MALSGSGRTQHFMALDGLRGVAALIVMIYHCRGWVSADAQWHGYLAVDFFFLLSGFVIAHAYGARIAERRLSFSQFIAARVIRLYPLIVLGAIMGTAGFIFEGIEKHWLGLCVRAIAALPFGMLALPQFFLQEPFQPNGPIWSLFFEIIANIAFFFVVPRLSTRLVAILATVLGFALALAIRSHGQVSFGWLWPTMPLGLLRVAFPFVTGVLLQRLHRDGRLRLPAAPIWVLAPVLAVALAMPVLGSWRGEIFYTLAALFLIFPLIVASASNDVPSPRWSRISALSAEISFPLYLVHAPILHVLGEISGFMALPLIIRLPSAIALCIATALAAGRLYDEPTRRWLRKQQAARREVRLQTTA